jgi:CRISPR-associated protein Cmr2
MQDLERRKLKRDWTAINWMGESSSLSGTDAIAWHQLGKESKQPGRSLTLTETQEQKDFYQRLSQALETASDGQFEGKFLDSSEKLSIPELVKRLVTRYEDIGRKLSKEFYIESFSEMVRLPKPGQPGHWTGWFMGDGDEVGKKLKELVQGSNGTQPLREFSDAMRKWGKDFKRDFPPNLGRVVYAGGDDFLGVIYSKNPKEPIAPSAALNWLMGLNEKWNQHGQDITVSVGFVWAGHSVPQRDILQHCREAEQRAKSLGRNRVTIRVVFNSGQFVQWTCPWDYLHVLRNYRDRDGKTWGNKSNWTHIYNDWAQLKARHAIPLKEKSDSVDDRIALALFDLYFGDSSPRTDGLKPINKDYLIDSENSKHIIRKDSSSAEFIEWIDGLINIGWQLCSNS